MGSPDLQQLASFRVDVFALSREEPLAWLFGAKGENRATGGLFGLVGGAFGAGASAGVAQTTHNYVNFNVSCPETGGYARSEPQISALLTQAIAPGQRNL